MDFYQDFIVLGNRLFFLLELENIRRAVFCVDDGFHLSLDQASRGAARTSGVRHFKTDATRPSKILKGPPQPLSLGCHGAAPVVYRRTTHRTQALTAVS